MAFNINDFRSSFNLGEIANPTNYEVKISRFPLSLNPYLYDTIDNLRYRCESCTMPGRNIRASARRTYGPIRKIAVGAEYDDVSFSFIVSESLPEKDFFYKWHELIINNDNDTSLFDTSYYDDYIGDIEIIHYNKNGDKEYTIVLQEAYPISIQDSPLSWNANNDYVRVNVNIAYRKFIEIREKSVGFN